jgi:dTDP-4-dehydrorhamnose reductase
MRLLVVGREGQLAQSIARQATRRADIETRFLGRPELDLEEPESARAAILSASPDIVINTAAYTAVDQAEEEPERAFRINATAAGEIAAAAEQAGAPVIYLSTDYVFDGTATAPLDEQQPVSPINVYGRSKLAGEEQVRSANPRHLILRTAWLFSPYGRNFVRTMLRLASSGGHVRVVEDQYGNPTEARDLAKAMLDIVAHSGVAWGRTYHLAGSEATNWAELARQVFAASAALGGPVAEVKGIPTHDYPTPAQRPLRTMLDSRSFADDLGISLPPYCLSVAPCVRDLLVGATGSQRAGGI